MALQLKPLAEQVIFITGASSGIGRVTAKHAAAAGAKVVAVARNEEALKELIDEIQKAGGEAVHAIADVADPEQLKLAADVATNAFGRIDTWVNNAGVGFFTDITKNTEVDDKKLFETNFWGVVHGSRIAVQYLRDGGALINLGSEVSDITTPTQGMYAASKHAIMGFTDAFRMEIIKSELPISVTLIKPAAIDTPFAKHARNSTGKQATLPAPVYAPELVADQILHAAQYPVRDLYVGGGGRAMALLAEHFPTLSDWVISKFMPSQELKDEPADTSNEALHDVGGAYEERGGLKGERIVREKSLYGVASRNPLKTYGVIFGIAAAAAAVTYYLLKPEQAEANRFEKFKRAARDYTAGPLGQAKKAARQYYDDYAAEHVGRAKDAARGYYDDATEYADNARSSARRYGVDAADRVKSAIHDTADAATRAKKSARGTVGDAVERAHDAAQDYVLTPAEHLIETVKEKISKYLK